MTRVHMQGVTALISDGQQGATVKKQKECQAISQLGIWRSLLLTLGRAKLGKYSSAKRNKKQPKLIWIQDRGQTPRAQWISMQITLLLNYLKNRHLPAQNKLVMEKKGSSSQVYMTYKRVTGELWYHLKHVLCDLNHIPWEDNISFKAQLT